jgi:ketosteroid isomerase-like protein
MSTDSIAVLRRALDAVSRGDIATVLDQLAPEVTYTLRGETALSGVYRGRDAVVQDLFVRCAALLAAPPRFTVHRWLHGGDTLVVELERQAQLRSGAGYRDRVCLILRLADQRVVEVTDLPVTAGVSRALAVPSSAAAVLRAFVMIFL